MTAPLSAAFYYAAGVIVTPVLDLLAPKGEEEVYEFAERELRLSSNVTSKPGKLELRAYQKGAWSPLWAWRRYADILKLAATQTGKTLEEQITVAYTASEAPGPGMMVFPTEGVLKRRSKKHMQTFLRDNLPHLISRNKHDMGLMEYTLAHGMTINLAHSGSPSALAGEPIKYLWMDETAKFKPSTDKEPGAEHNARERTKSFHPFHRIWNSTTPTGEKDPGWRDWPESTQCQYHVPCKDCGEDQVLYFGEVDFRIFEPNAAGEYPGGVRWDRDESLSKDERLESVYYQCAHCESRWNDYDLNAAVDAGKWVPRNPQAKRYGSHINSLAAPSITMAEMTEKWWNSYKNGEDRKTFFNSWLGVYYKETGQTASEKLLRSRELAGHYEGMVPRDAVAVFLTVDVHDDHLRYRVRAWAPDGRSWGVQQGQIPRDWDLLDNILLREYVGGHGEPRRIDRCWIDCNYRRQEVYQYCLRHAGLCHPISGVPRKMREPWSYAFVTVVPDMKAEPPLPLGGELWILEINDHQAKNDLFNTIAINPGDPGCWYLEEDLPDAYFYQMQGEYRAEKMTKHGPVQEWIYQHENHALDCEKYQLVAYHALGVAGANYMEEEEEEEEPTEVWNPWTKKFVKV